MQKICHSHPIGFPILRPGAGAESQSKAGFVMKHVTYRAFAGLLFASLALVSTQPQTAVAQDTVRAADPSICIDGMETAPDSDDLEPILAAADAGCAAPQGPISI